MREGEHTKENRLGLDEALMFVAPDDEFDEIRQHLSRNKIFVVAFMCPVCVCWQRRTRVSCFKALMPQRACTEACVLGLGSVCAAECHLF